MSFSQSTLLGNFHHYLNNRGREEFSLNLSPGYCFGLVLLFCYFAQIDKVDNFYELVKAANSYNNEEDNVIIERINNLKSSTEWQKANEKFKLLESQITTNPNQNYNDRIHEAKKNNLITNEEAQTLLRAVLPDNPDIEKILNYVEILQRARLYVKDISSRGSLLELIRDIDKDAATFSQNYKNEPEFEDVVILPKEKLNELLNKLPENKAIILGSGRHAFSLLKKNGSYIFFDSNSTDRLPDFKNSEDLANHLLSDTFEGILIGSHVPISMEILAQENQKTPDYAELKTFCSEYRKTENAKFVHTNTKDTYPIDGITPLIISLSAGLTKTTETLIKQREGIDTSDAIGFYPTHYAAFNGDQNILTQLLAEGVDVNQEVSGKTRNLDNVTTSLHDSIKGAPPLFFSCAANNVAGINMLLDNGADINKASESGFTPLMVAAYQGHHEAVKTLIKRGAKLNTDPIYMLNGTTYESKTVKQLTPLEYYGAVYLPEYEGYNAAMIAAKRNQPDIILELLNAGIDIHYSNKYGMTLLHLCAMNGLVNQEILNYKPNINSLVKFSQDSSDVISPLWIACYKNNIDAVKLLLNNGANPNIQNENELPPLVKAVESGSLEIMNMLIERGADSKINFRGDSLLDIALRNENTHLIAPLLKIGVEPNETNLDSVIMRSMFKKNKNYLGDVSNILSWMVKNDRPIPQNQRATGNTDLLVSMYKNLSAGKLENIKQLILSMAFCLDSYTSSNQTNFFSNAKSSVFTKLSNQLFEMKDHSFSALKEELKKTADNNKLSSDEVIFLNSLSTLINDFELKVPQERPTSTIQNANK